MHCRLVYQYKKQIINHWLEPISFSMMKALYIFLAVVGLSSANDEVSRIVGGAAVASANVIPYQLGLSVSNRYKCGAVIISNQVALTSAQCVYGATPSTITVLAGSVLRSSGTLYTAASVVLHPNFSGSTYDYDIAILRFTTNITLTANVGVIPLPSAGETIAVGTPVQVSGWGALSTSDATLAGTLQAVTVPIVSNSDCAAALGRINRVTNRMLCAGDLTGKSDFCGGDTGGPLVYAGRLIGLASWGEKCGTLSSPGVYTRISALRDWIRTEAGV